MVVDFRLLKEKTRALLERLDHRYLNELSFFKDQNPSAENLAFFLFQELSPQIDQGSRHVSWVAVWESDTSRAVYRRSSP
jgi:6-pyruvoyltetrahydropterin/6-carboxytetrahydropterin synthase